MNQLFRKTSLERLASPEQLDKLLTITSLRGWIALLSMAGIIGIAFAWGFLGSIPTKVNTSGVLISSGGTVGVYAPIGGTVTDIRIQNGDTLAQGDIIAILGENTLAEEISDLKERLAVLENLTPESGWGFLALPSQLAELKTLGLQIQSQVETVTAAEKQCAYLEKKLEPSEMLYAEGAISRQELEDERHALSQAQDEYDQQVLALNQLTVRFNSLKQTDLQEYRELLVEKQDSLLHDYVITSPVDGRVMSVSVQKGSVIAAGSSVAGIAKTGSGVQELEAIIYVPVSEGKKIREGMDAKIYPSTVTREEYGYMKGTVSEVPQYPVSAAAMQSTLGNEALAQALSQNGAPLEVRVTLVTDNTTVSGFAWSSQKGADLNVENGTLCSASVVVDAQRPVSLVIPLLKEKILPIE